MSTLIMKFGGTSVGSAEAIAQVCGIVKSYYQDWERLVVVVSAMRGVTDSLIRCADLAVQREEYQYLALIEQINQSHHTVMEEVVSGAVEIQRLSAQFEEHISELTAYCRSIHVLGEVTPRGMDTITSLGERMNAPLVAAALRTQGLAGQAVDAAQLIVTDDSFQNANPSEGETRNKVDEVLQPLLNEKVIPVVTGFVAATQDGILTTLGRGGSDYTAAILGDSLDASEVWTWTDVDGIMTADPRIVANARVIPELSFSEVSELAYFGAKVLHPKTLRPIIERDIPLWAPRRATMSR